MINKSCVCCNKNFISKSKYTQTCSKSCASKYRWDNKEYKDRVTESIKKAAKDPIRNEKISKFHKEYQNLNTSKERQSLTAKQQWLNTEYRSKTSSAIKHSLSSMHEELSIINKEIANRPDVQDKKREKMILLWETSEYQIKASNSQKIAQNNMHTVDKRRLSMINRWKDPEFAHTQFKYQTKYKEFILPSGKVIKLQGYEPYVLSDLLKIYKDEDIVTGVKNINQYIGRIFYTQDKIKRSYYPDFYIKSTNTIVEVKSTYTFKKHEEKNLLKKQACIDAGFNFEFIIL